MGFNNLAYRDKPSVEIEATTQAIIPQRGRTTQGLVPDYSDKPWTGERDL